MKKLAVIAALINTLTCGCMSPIQGNTELLAFLNDGQTTRRETLAQLGQPSLILESDHLLTYRLGGDAQNGYFIRRPQSHGQSWAGTNFSLVLLFGKDGILESHSLVRIR